MKKAIGLSKQGLNKLSDFCQENFGFIGGLKNMRRIGGLMIDLKNFNQNQLILEESNETLRIDFTGEDFIYEESE